MSEEKQCPCDTVIELRKKTDEQEKRLNDGNVNFAVINTKLNLIMAVMSAIGTALVGVIVKIRL